MRSFLLVVVVSAMALTTTVSAGYGANGEPEQASVALPPFPDDDTEQMVYEWFDVSESCEDEASFLVSRFTCGDYSIPLRKTDAVLELNGERKAIADFEDMAALEAALVSDMKARLTSPEHEGFMRTVMTHFMHKFAQLYEDVEIEASMMFLYTNYRRVFYGNSWKGLKQPAGPVLGSPLGEHAFVSFKQGGVGAARFDEWGDVSLEENELGPARLDLAKYFTNGCCRLMWAVDDASDDGDTSVNKLWKSLDFEQSIPVRRDLALSSAKDQSLEEYHDEVCSILQSKRDCSTERARERALANRLKGATAAVRQLVENAFTMARHDSFEKLMVKLKENKFTYKKTSSNGPSMLGRALMLGALMLSPANAAMHVGSPTGPAGPSATNVALYNGPSDAFGNSYSTSLALQPQGRPLMDDVMSMDHVYSSSKLASHHADVAPADSSLAVADEVASTRGPSSFEDYASAGLDADDAEFAKALNVAPSVSVAAGTPPLREGARAVPDGYDLIAPKSKADGAKLEGPDGTFVAYRSGRAEAIDYQFVNSPSESEGAATLKVVGAKRVPDLDSPEWRMSASKDQPDAQYFNDVNIGLPNAAHASDHMPLEGDYALTNTANGKSVTFKSKQFNILAERAAEIKTFQHARDYLPDDAPEVLKGSKLMDQATFKSKVAATRLDFEKRKDKLWGEMMEGEPDVLTMEEVDNQDYWVARLQNAGYTVAAGKRKFSEETIRKKQIDDRSTDGNVIAFKSDKFEQVGDAVNVAYDESEFADDFAARRASKKERAGLFVTLRAVDNGAEMIVGATHLSYDNVSEIGRKMIRNEARQARQQVDKMNAARDKPVPVLLSGDFNSTPDSEVVKDMKDAGFVSTYAEAYGAEPPATSAYPTTTYFEPKAKTVEEPKADTVEDPRADDDSVASLRGSEPPLPSESGDVASSNTISFDSYAPNGETMADYVTSVLGQDFFTNAGIPPPGAVSTDVESSADGGIEVVHKWLTSQEEAELERSTLFNVKRTQNNAALKAAGADFSLDDSDVIVVSVGSSSTQIYSNDESHTASFDCGSKKVGGAAEAARLAKAVKATGRTKVVMVGSIGYAASSDMPAFVTVDTFKDGAPKAVPSIPDMAKAFIAEFGADNSDVMVFNRAKAHGKYKYAQMDNNFTLGLTDKYGAEFDKIGDWGGSSFKIYSKQGQREANLEIDANKLMVHKGRVDEGMDKYVFDNVVRPFVAAKEKGKGVRRVLVAQTGQARELHFKK